MPELKHFDPQAAVQAVENAAKVARERLDEATRDALAHLKDAQDGILALEQGVGPLLERAEHVFVATFTTDSPRRGSLPGKMAMNDDMHSKEDPRCLE